MAHLVRQHGYIHHFNSLRHDITKSKDFLTNICAQMITRFKLNYLTLPDHVTQGPQFLSEVLEKAARKSKGPLVILVDALDETEQGELEVYNTLALPGALPPKTYVVMTCRKDLSKHKLQFAKYEKEIINANESWNLQDIRLYIEGKLKLEGMQSYMDYYELKETEFCDTLVEHSQGNFMYLRHVIPDISVSTKKWSPKELPIGLEGYYKSHYERMKVKNQDQWNDYKLRIIMLLSCAPGPISIKFLSDHLKAGTPTQVQQVLEEWRSFLHIEKWENRNHYKFYHKSFDDFLQKRKRSIPTN